MKTLKQPLTIPRFYCPISSVIHPDHDWIEQRSIDWFRGFGFFPGKVGGELLKDWRFTELAARAHPEEDPARVLLMADLVHWTIFDDSHVDGIADQDAEMTLSPDLGFSALAVKIARLLETPESGLIPSNPWTDSLIDLRMRLASMATDAQVARWIASVREYLLAASWRNAFGHARTMPSVADYVTLRLPDGGVQMFVTLADVIGGYELTEAELNQPTIRALTEMALTLVAWDNDFFSQYKEAVRDDLNINLIDVIAAEKGCGAQEAVGIAVALRDRVMCRYLSVRGETERSLTDAQRRYATTLDRWIAANIDMSMVSTRYLNPLNQPASETAWVHFDPVRAGGPSNDSTEPLPFPDIAWWWKPANLGVAKV